MDLPKPRNPEQSQYNQEAEPDGLPMPSHEQQPNATERQPIEAPLPGVETELSQPEVKDRDGAGQSSQRVSDDPANQPDPQSTATNSAGSNAADDPDGTQPMAVPAIADDVDVIEQAWVDKAKQVIAATRTDPYRQEEEVEKLQIEYLKKRYGKTIGSAD